MRTFWMTVLFHVVMCSGVCLTTGCQPSNSGISRADAGIPSSPSSSVGILPSTPSRRNVAFQDQNNNGQDELALLTALLENIQKLYQQSYRGGKIRDWSAYLESQKMLKQAHVMAQHIASRLQKQSPAQAKQVRKTVSAFQRHILHKSHPQRLRLLHYELMYRYGQIDTKVQAQYLQEYKETLQTMSRDFVASQEVGLYRVGLFVRKPRAYFRWKEINFSDRSHLIRPDRRSKQMLVVQVFDAKTGVPLAGTDVTLELFDAQSNHKILSHRMDQLWDGMSMYVHNLAFPRSLQKKVRLQISVSPFPWTRTQRGLRDYMQPAVARFVATIHGGQVKIAASHPAPSWLTTAAQLVGTDVMRAITAVGGTVLETPLHRVGVALIPTETLWQWKGGSLVPSKPKPFFNTQVVAFVQDKKTGLLVPDARIQFFYEWMEPKSRYEFQKYLKPVYDGFPSYRTVIRMKPTNYNLRLRVDAPLSASFSKIRYPSYSVEIKDFQPPFR